SCGAGNNTQLTESAARVLVSVMDLRSAPAVRFRRHSTQAVHRPHFVRDPPPPARSRGTICDSSASFCTPAFRTLRYTGYVGEIVVLCPFAPRSLGPPSPTYNSPPPAGFTDGTTEALAIAITPCPPPNWRVAPNPMFPPAARR